MLVTKMNSRMNCNGKKKNWSISDADDIVPLAIMGEIRKAHRKREVNFKFKQNKSYENWRNNRKKEKKELKMHLDEESLHNKSNIMLIIIYIINI